LLGEGGVLGELGDGFAGEGVVGSRGLDQFEHQLLVEALEIF